MSRFQRTLTGVLTISLTGILSCTHTSPTSPRTDVADTEEIVARAPAQASGCSVAVKGKGKSQITQAHKEACLSAATAMEPQPKITTLDHIRLGPGEYMQNGLGFKTDQRIQCYYVPHYHCWPQASSQSQKFRCITADQNWGANDDDQRTVGQANAVGPCLGKDGKPKIDAETKKEKIECLYAGSKPILDADGEGIEGDQIKVKYMKSLSEERQREVMTEVAATRFLWALGFVADRNYTVGHVGCKGCAPDPWGSKQCPIVSGDQEQAFPISAIERKYEGKDIGVKGDDSWEWSKVSQLYKSSWSDNQKVGYEAYVTSLRLFNIFNFIGKQNRLMCAKYVDANNPNVKSYNKKAPGGVSECARPVAYMQDVGSSFGRDKSMGANSRGNHNDYNQMGPIMGASCDLDKGVQSSTGVSSLSKEGQDVLSARIKYLEDTLGKTGERYNWALEIFKTARFDKVDPKMKGSDEDKVNAWYDSFYKHIGEIKSAKCSSRYPNFKPM